MPNAGEEKKSSAVRDKVVWKEKVVLDNFDIASWTPSNLEMRRWTKKELHLKPHISPEEGGMLRWCTTRPGWHEPF